jgi:hypothetical protein
MTIKIECACGTRLGFDVEPENGRMPVPVNCPSCETDITSLADVFIAQNSASAAPMRVTVRVAGSAPPPPPAPAEGSAAPTSPPPPPPASSYKAAALQRTIAAAAGPKIEGDEEYPDARVSDAEAGKLMVWIKRGLAVAGVFVVVWAWYAFYASKPRESYSLTTAEGAPFRHARLLDAERLFVLTTQKVAVRNVKSDQEIWAATLAKEEQVNLDLGPRSGGLSDRERNQLREVALPDAVVRVAGGDIWVALANKVVRFDGATGRRKVEVPLPSQFAEVEAGDAAIVILGDAAGNQRTVTRIDLATGKFATETVAPSPAPVRAPARAQEDSFPDMEFTPAGTGVTLLTSRLLERRYVTREGATTESRAEREAKPLIERDNLRAADSTEAAVQFLKLNQGEAAEFDESRYHVTLRRLFGGGAQWSGEVSGHPAFFAAPGVDLLVAGTELRGFDASLRLLWTLKLSYPAGGSEFGDDEERMPFAGGGSRLYFFDLGTLTALDPRTGKVQWRLPSVGISQVVPVGPALYVSTTSAGPEAIKGSGGVSLNDRVYPVLVKLDAATGKVLWQLDRVADRALVSGKFVYASRASSSLLDQMSASMNGEDARVQFSARRLDPDTGKELWTWRRNGAPKQFEALDNRLLVRSSTEVKLLKFTAW